METITLSNKIETLIDNSQYTKAVNLLKKELKINLKVLSSRFGSMEWDKDKQKRTIFDLELSKNGETYIFEFGSSLASSCKEVEKTKISLMKPTDKIDFYAGLKLTEKLISCGVAFTLTLEQAQNLEYEFIEEKAEDLRKQLNINIDKNNKRWYDAFDKGNISRNERDKKASMKYADNGMFIQCVTNAVKRELTKLQEEKETVFEGELDKVKNPTLYDVLACLQKYDVGNFEDFCSMFGYDEDSRKAEKTYNAVSKEYENMQRLFNDEELELLQIIN